MNELRKGTEKYYEWEDAVDFIRKEMQFYSKEDFLNEKRLIKVMYMTCNDLEKQLYKWYVFSRYMSYSFKCNIWEYLNNRNANFSCYAPKKKKKKKDSN